jgi:hypothetical protein
MVFIWRGSGISVPIILFLCARITTHWFEGAEIVGKALSNASFLACTFLWSGLITLLQALVIVGMRLADRTLGANPPKTHHDFFWIPVWLWGVIFIVLSGWFFIS